MTEVRPLFETEDTETGTKYRLYVHLEQTIDGECSAWAQICGTDPVYAQSDPYDEWILLEVQDLELETSLGDLRDQLLAYAQNNPTLPQ